MKKLFFTTLIFFLLCLSVNATDYHADQDGGAANLAACSGADPGNGSRCDTEDVEDITAGNTVYWYDDGGVITGQINVSQNGSSGNVITHVKAVGETPVFTRSGSASFDINDKEYIKLDGLTFTGGSGRQVYAYNGSHYLEIDDCTFSGISSYSSLDIRDSNYPHVHDNTFGAGPAASEEADETDDIHCIDVDYGRFISNSFSVGNGHMMIWLSDCDYNVIRSNDFETTTATNGNEYGTADSFINLSKCEYNLVELNTMNCQTTPDADNWTYGVYISGSSSFNITRKNTVNTSLGPAFNVWNSTGTSQYNQTYNNTAYDSNPNPISGEQWGCIVLSKTDSGLENNRFLNNICSESGEFGVAKQSNAAGEDTNYFSTNIFYNIDVEDVYYEGTPAITITAAEDTYGSEFEDGTHLTGDPKFTTPGSDFTLQSNSPAIDAGAWLTTINQASGSAQTITLDDYPYMFYDGFGISGETGDTIKTENGQTGVIQSINYGAKTITLTSAIQIVDNEGIGLDYSGIKSDIGAEEYSSPSPGVGIEDPTPANGVTGQGLAVDPSWTNGAGVTDTDIYADKVDCSTEVDNDGVAETTYDLTTTHDETWYWKVVVNPDDENLTFPPTGCYSFTTITTPSVLGGAVYDSNAGAGAYSSGGATWGYLP